MHLTLTLGGRHPPKLSFFPSHKNDDFFGKAMNEKDLNCLILYQLVVYPVWNTSKNFFLLIEAFDYYLGPEYGDPQTRESPSNSLKVSRTSRALISTPTISGNLSWKGIIMDLAMHQIPHFKL